MAHGQSRPARLRAALRCRDGRRVRGLGGDWRSYAAYGVARRAQGGALDRLECESPNLRAECPSQPKPTFSLILASRSPLFSQPHFDDVKERTIEAYLCHDFGGRDFYDQEMKLIVCAFLRPQAKFENFDALIEAISTDVEFGKTALDSPPLLAMRDDAFFAAEQPQEADALK